MKKKIAVICAPLHGEFNPGMNSVDLGAYSLLKRTFPESDVHFYLLHEPEPHVKDVLYPQLPFTYEVFYNKLELIYQCDCIIFWGDFLHCYPFHLGLSKRLVRYGLAKDEADALNVIRKHFLLSEAPDEVLSKTIIFGSNFFINETTGILNETYKSSTFRLLKLAHRVWCRDILSAMRIAQVLGDFNTNFLGIDCSFFYEKKAIRIINALPQKTQRTTFKRLLSIGNTKNSKCGVFLGRMPKNVGEILPFINSFSNEVDAELEYLPWFWQSNQHYNKVRSGLSSIYIPSKKFELMELYSKIKDYNFIITDTYHLCLNAWRQGVPAICIGNGNSFLNSTLTDKKKEFFFLMYNAPDFYVFLGDIKSRKSRKEKINKITSRISNPDVINSIFNNIEMNLNSVEIELTKSISAAIK